MYTVKLTETNLNLIISAIEIISKIREPLLKKGHLASKDFLALLSLRESLKEHKSKADTASGRTSSYAKMLEQKAVKIMNERQCSLKDAYAVLFETEKGKGEQSGS